MSPANSREIIASLKDFQQRTVEHAFDRLYLAMDSTQRFLVADEVGMGKTLVARGVIAKAVEHLEDEPTVDRIDIIYICSNSAIARQNIQKLNIFGKDTKHPNTRITMLASQAHGLNEKTIGRKTVNLVAFTPGTSFEKGQRGGKRGERALIYVMLKELFLGSEKKLSQVLRLNVKAKGWKESVTYFAEQATIDEEIKKGFITALQSSPVWTSLAEFVEECSGSGDLSKAMESRARRLIGPVRTVLARASVDALEPDLIVLDEFQRFKHLLEVPAEDTPDSDVRFLAQQLFDFPGVRTLLLSATPYKLFTMAAEEGVTGDDHYKDFLATTKFLVKEDAQRVSDIEDAFRSYRDSLISGVAISESKSRAQDLLVKVMARTERPTIGESGMGLELDDPLLPPSAEELAGYVAMDRMALGLETSVHVDYWKSAPYFLNFMDGYKVGRTFIEAIEDEGHSLIPQHAQVIQPAQLNNRKKIEPGNARLRNLQKQVVESGLWKLLWLPPSLPYLQLAGPYSDVDRAQATKRLIFSSWSAAPNSISSLLSHEVATRVFAALEPGRNPYKQTKRLAYRKGDGHAKGMTTFTLFTPIPELALKTDVLDVVRSHPGELLTSEQAVQEVMANVGPQLVQLVGRPVGPRSEAWFWIAPLLFMQKREGLRHLESLEYSDGDSEEKDSEGRHQSLETACNFSTDKLGETPAGFEKWVSMLGMFGPGNIAYRSLKRTTDLLNPDEETLLYAAAVIGEGFRSLFNRAESMFLIDQVYSDTGEDYWQRVLRYCMDGDLQSVVDEYLHHLVVNSSPQNDKDIIDLAMKICEGLSLKTSPVNLFNPRKTDERMTVNTRFAVRYGSSKGSLNSDENSEKRMVAVQQAFNSPFWPMVLASTSVGQEGVDFHWWCHSLVHWNLPSNPVDMEQREGRIHRFAGHAVRKNIAAKYVEVVATAKTGNPWEALFEAAVEDRSTEIAKEMGDLWPWWVFPGDSKIVTWTPVLPFSKDEERLKRMKRLRAIYRLAFGQPRQEDLMSIINENAENFTSLNLEPPARGNSNLP